MPQVVSTFLNHPIYQCTRVSLRATRSIARRSGRRPSVTVIMFDFGPVALPRLETTELGHCLSPPWRPHRPPVRRRAGEADSSSEAAYPEYTLYLLLPPTYYTNPRAFPGKAPHRFSPAVPPPALLLELRLWLRSATARHTTILASPSPLPNGHGLSPCSPLRAVQLYCPSA